MIARIFLGLICGCCVITGPVAADEGGPPLLKEVWFVDDWPADSFLAPGRMWCPGGELEMLNPLTPLCHGSDRLRVRDVEMYSCVTTLDTFAQVEPRMTGTMWFSVNANLDDMFNGKVFGKFVLVPGNTCDAGVLLDPGVMWQGTWQGERNLVCDSDCYWIARFRIVAQGYGDGLDGLEYRGEESIRTFTPLPAPWELIPDFPWTGPEGTGVGVIRE